MRPLGHRDPGVLGEVLTDDKVSADIIADGIHLHPAAIKLLATLALDDTFVKEFTIPDFGAVHSPAVTRERMSAT